MSTKIKSEKTDSLLRIPKAKNKLGLRIPKIAMPHDDLIVAEKPKLEIVPNKNESPNLSSLTTMTRQSSHSSQTRLSRQSTDDRGEVAPTKNYQKVANSITKQAIPDGFFKGKDKHLYDVLYSLTRGAIEPKRSVRVSKTKLMKLSSIGSRITFDACIERLLVVGLLNLKVFAGAHEGNEFEILLPEEITTLSSLTSQSSQTSPAQKLDRLLTLESSQTSQSVNSVNSTVYNELKTSFKDNTKTDDEASAPFSEFFEKISKACERITGKPTTGREREKWGTLADLLILEFETAARKTDSISSAPAFLTEVLRRKLVSGVSSANTPKSQKAKPDTVGKPDETGKYEIKPLDEQGRNEALEHLREFADSAFLIDFKQWYTEEDWTWITKQLEIKS